MSIDNIKGLIKYLNRVLNSTTPRDYFNAVKQFEKTVPFIYCSEQNEARELKKVIIKFMKNMPRDMSSMLSDEIFMKGFEHIFHIMTGYIQRRDEIDKPDFELFSEFVDSMKGIDTTPFYKTFAWGIHDIHDIDMMDFVLSIFYTLEMDNAIKREDESRGLSNLCRFNNKKHNEAVDNILKKHGFRSNAPVISPPPIETDCDIMLRTAIENKCIPSVVHRKIIECTNSRNIELVTLVNNIDMPPATRAAWFQFLTEYNFPFQNDTTGI